jgi:CLIP-associating protein 1/2
MSPIPLANDTLTLSPHPSDDESLMRLRAPNSEAGSSESLPMASFSDAYTSTPPGRAAETALLTRSTNPVKIPGPVIEDDLRARAEQAESAAERLLEELAEPDDTVQNIHLPPSLVQSTSQHPNGGSTPRVSKHTGGTTKVPAPTRKGAPPATPANRISTMRQGAAFQDSPAYKSGSHSMIDRLKDNRHESSWWLKRVARKSIILAHLHR